MTQLVSSLPWQDSAQYQGPVATLTVDLSADPDWRVTVQGWYQDKPTTPRFCQVDNIGNAQQIAISFNGNLAYTVNQYTRKTFPVPAGTTTVEFEYVTNSGTAAPFTARFSPANISFGDDVNIYAIQQAAKTGGLLRQIQQKTASYAISASDLSNIIIVTAGAPGIVITLPDATASDIGNGFNCEAWNSAASADQITVTSQGGQEIFRSDGNTTTSVPINPGQRWTFVSDGTNWNADIDVPVSGPQGPASVGQVPYFNNASAARLGAVGPGAVGTVLMGQGAGNPPIFGSLVQGSPIAVKTATYNMVAGDVGSFFVFNSGSAATLNLVAASAVANGSAIYVKAFGGGAVTLDAAGTDTIISQASNLATAVLWSGDGGYLVSNGVGQWVWLGDRHYDSGDQTITANGTLTLTHNLGVIPSIVHVYFHNATANAGYSVGDFLLARGGVDTNASQGDTGISVVPTATAIGIAFSTTFIIVPKGGGAPVSMTLADWKLVIRAYVHD